VEKPKGRNHLEDLGADVKVILTRIIEKQNGLAGTGSVWVRTGTRGEGGGHCEHDREPPNSTECGEFLDQMRNPYILEKNSAPCSQQVS
jgi:hypothetical protein